MALRLKPFRLLIPLFLFVLVGVGVVYLAMMNRSSRRILENNLILCDRHTADGAVGKAINALAKTLPAVTSIPDWERVLKRALALAEISGDYSLLLNTTEKAFGQFPSNQKITAFHAMALLWNGETIRSATLLNRLSSEEYYPLKMEIFFRSEEERLNSDGTIEITTINDLLDEFGSEIYFRSAEFLDDERFLYNAALYFMERGEAGRAFQLTRDLNYPSMNLEGAGLIAYDAQAYDEAVARFSTLKRSMSGNLLWSREVTQWLGDSYYHLGRIPEAIEQYEEITARGEETWKIRLNLAKGYFEIGDPTQGMDILLEGIARYNGKSELLFLYYLNAEAADLPILQRFIDDYQSKHEETARYTVLSLLINKDRLSPSYYRAAAWDVFNRNPSSPDAAKFLLWYLVGIDDLTGVELVLNRYEAQNDTQPAWLNEYRGILSALGGQQGTAIILFEESLKEEPTWHRYLNLSTMELIRKNDERALSLMNNALEIVSDTNNPTYKSTIHLRLAAFHAMAGNPEAKDFHISEIEKLTPNDFDINLAVQEFKQSDSIEKQKTG